MLLGQLIYSAVYFCCFLPNFLPNDLYTSENRELKTIPIILLKSISPFRYSNIFLVYLVFQHVVVIFLAALNFLFLLFLNLFLLLNFIDKNIFS